MKLKFFGATDQVTGSKHLLTTTKGKNYLLDCGMYQGRGKEIAFLNQEFPEDPEKIEAIILSHAHIDHSGLIPYFFKKGFRGKVYCTPATFQVCEILLQDSAHIQEQDVKFVNKRRAKENLTPIKPLYTTNDAEKCLKLFKVVPLHTRFRLCDEVEFIFTDAGHILGSASIHLKLFEEEKEINLSFSGDVGRYNDLLLKSPESFPQADYIICESTYGDELHEKHSDGEMVLLNLVRKTCIEKKGKLIIPAFSIGRTQEIVFSLDKMKNAGLLPPINVYVDSPLSTNATDIMRDNLELLNDNIQEYAKKDPDPFGFNNLHYIKSAEESKKLNFKNEPCIIISASGMADAGRIKHHIMHAVGSSRNTVLIAGYCSPNSLGGELLARKKSVRIFGDYFEVKADVENVSSYSAHADYEELLKYLSCQKQEMVKKVFLVHGEKNAKSEFLKKLNKVGFKDVLIPVKNEIFQL
ncbi:MAG: MBL fold metallo-hydrolase RNA specificity domain-containing protein [Bacteroidota bacterium]|jgi:metallo-beta-lactamase family protein